MNAQHTPGPWEHVRLSGACGPHAIRMPYKDGKMFYGVREIAREEDARLIVSAPALLEALRAARKIIADIDDYMKRPGRGDWGEECACCMGELLDDDRDAIARIDAALAKGESA